MKIFIKLILVLFVFFNITLPLGVLAADTPGEKVGEAIGMDSLGFTANVAIGDFKDCDFGSGGENNCLGKYIQAWYGFAVGIVGILATFMIMYAGFKYLTSRGDGKAINDAKDIMISGISGIVIAFLSYTVLNLVNPQLLIIHMPSLPSIQDTSGTDLSKQSATTQSPGSGGSGVNKGSQSTQQQTQPIKDACGGSSGALNYDSMNIPATERPGVSFQEQSNGRTEDYWFDCYGQKYGVDSNMLRAISAAESDGNANIGSSPAGACGLMQIVPSTATALAGRSVDCSELNNNASLSIQLAAQYLSQNQGNLNVYDQIAGYNGGYDTTSGSGHALSPSQDCPGVRAYQCCTNPGGLTETQNYVYNVDSYYQYYQQSHQTQTLSDPACN